MAFSDDILEHNSNNFLAAIHFGNDSLGIAFLYVSTAEFMAAQGNTEYVDKLLQSLKPTEVLFQKGNQQKFIELFGNKFYFLLPVSMSSGGIVVFWFKRSSVNVP